MKLLKQKTTGEIYLWTALLAKRDDMEEYVRPMVPTIVLPPEPPPKEMVDEVVNQEEVNEEETSVGETEPQQEKPKTQPKGKSPSKGKR